MTPAPEPSQWALRQRIFGLIDEERIRQTQLWGAQWNPGFAGDMFKLAILMEEVGEVATDVQDGRSPKEELVHVAAVAVAWLESMADEVGSETDEKWRPLEKSVDPESIAQGIEEGYTKGDLTLRNQELAQERDELQRKLLRTQEDNQKLCVEFDRLNTSYQGMKQLALSVIENVGDGMALHEYDPRRHDAKEGE